VSSPLLTSRPQEPGAAGWERLIPGESALLRVPKKPPQTVKATRHASGTVADISREEPPHPPEHTLALLMPSPLQNRSAWQWLRSTAADFALVGLNCLVAAVLLATLQALFPRVRGIFPALGAPGSLLGIALLQGALITLVGYSEGLYAQSGDLKQETRTLGKSVLWATTVLCFAYTLQGAPWTTSVLICGVGCLNFGALWIRRWRTDKRQGQPQARDARNVLIVGAGAVGRRVASYVDGHPAAGRMVCGFLDDERSLGEGIIGRVSDLGRLARTEFVDEVILAGPHDRSLTLDVLHEARRLHLDVEIIPELFGCRLADDAVERIGDLPVICLHAERLPAAGLIAKRLVDIAGAGLVLAALSPLLAVVAGLIKLDSRGPVLYCAPRAGRKGRPFLCYKFRTMVHNADELKNNLRRNNQRSGPFFKIVGDPRITRLGHLLRRYSLDELPQLWNVLWGDMSLVGPRPHPLDDLAGYEVRHLARLDVTPGMTGLWQVTARRDPSFERGLELDREYIRTWSLASDLHILLKTVSAVIAGGGD